MCCRLIGIHRQLIQRIQSGGSLAALVHHEAQVAKSKADFSLCHAPTSGSSGAHGTTICRLEPWRKLCSDMASQQWVAFASGSCTWKL